MIRSILSNINTVLKSHILFIFILIENLNATRTVAEEIFSFFNDKF